MIEHIAHAAWSELARQDGVTIDPALGQVSGKVDMAALARAILNAMHKPSEAMATAYYALCEKQGVEIAPDATNTLEAMIDAALGERHAAPSPPA